MEINYDNGIWQRTDFAPLSFWAWNDIMDAQSIKQRIREYYEQGIHGFFMHSRAGLLTSYLSDEWFQACRVAVDEAAKYHMEAWIYDEDGWPSGFAGGLVNHRGIDYQAKYFDFVDQKPVDSSRILAAFQKTQDGYRRVEVDQGQVWAVYYVEEDYVDLLSAKVVTAFIEVTHERYKAELGDRLGTTVKGFFTDEPQYFGRGFPYSFELTDYFQKKNGYSMLDQLYQLMPAPFETEAYQFRLDFWNTIEEMMRINFSKQIFDWCHKNQVISTGHYPEEDSLIHQLRSTGGVMPKYQYHQIPGIDHLGKRTVSLLVTKQVTSVAKQMKQKRVLSETFGCAGWNIRFEDMCYIWGWQASQGINVPTLHIGAHSILGIRKRDYPAFYSYQEPWWQEFKHVSDWLSGIGYKLAQGKWIEKILVLSPLQSIYCLNQPGYLGTAAAREITAAYRNLLDYLVDVQVGFDIGDEIILAESGYLTGKYIGIGNCKYEQVIVPQTLILRDQTWQLLKGFMDNGGSVIFTNHLPEQAFQWEWTKDCLVIQNSRRFWNKYFKWADYQRPFTIYEGSGVALARGLNISIKQDGDTIRGYIWNLEKDSIRELSLMVRGAKQVFIIDPETLTRKELPVCSITPEETLARFKLTYQQSILMEIEPRNSNQETKDSALLSFQKMETLDKRPFRTNLNSLTIDYARFSLPEEQYSELMPITKLQSALYEALKNDKGQFFRVQYRFWNNTTQDSPVFVAVENRGVVEITCNQQSITSQSEGWYVDRGIRKYRLTEKLVSGQNIIEVTYQIESKTVKSVDGLFETEVNRFFYPVEPEAIYILGDFSVDPNCKVNRKQNHIRLKQPRFELRDSRPLIGEADLTEQGLWFYRGDIRMDFEVGFTGVGEKSIEIDNPEAACVTVEVNGSKQLLYMAPYIVDITNLLKVGSNRVSVILHGTNRNLLGPHHHIRGENDFVGGNTFRGEKGFEDRFENYDLKTNITWTDEYSFVRFGCGMIRLLTREKKKLEGDAFDVRNRRIHVKKS